MSTLDSCCSPCPTVQTVNYPGAAGPQGAAGAAGSDGTDAFAIVQSPGFTIPAVGNDVLAPVSNTAWMAVGEIVIAGTGFGGPVTGPANFRVISINSATTVTLRALAYPGDTVNPATIATSALLAPAGLQGPTGAAGSTFPTTTVGDIMFNSSGVAGTAIRLGIGSQGQALISDVNNANPALSLKYAGVVQSLSLDFITKGTGADTTEDTLQTYLIAANVLRNNSDAIEWEALFNVQTTAIVTAKIIKVYFGGTVVLQFGSAALNGGSLIMQGTVLRTGAATQLCYGSYVTTDSAAASTTKMSQTNASETLSGTVLLKVTGQNVTDSIANGIQQQVLKVGYRAA